MPACFVSRANASTYFTALDDASQSLSFSAIRDLTWSVPRVVLSIGSDLAAPCTRLKMEYAFRAAEHNNSLPRQNGVRAGVIALFNGECVAHICHREVEKMFKLYSVIPNLHAVAFAGSLSGMAAATKKALYDIIGRDSASFRFCCWLRLRCSLIFSWFVPVTPASPSPCSATPIN